jgi:hypothetical protein
VSKEHAKYAKWLKSRAPIVTAHYLNTSGIIGAAYAAGLAAHEAAQATPSTPLERPSPPERDSRTAPG